MPSFTCPRCHGDIRGEPAGYCRWCDALTGRCGATFLAGVLLTTGAVDLTGWSDPCTPHSTEPLARDQQVRRRGGTLFCASYGDACAVAAHRGSGLLLVFVGARDEA